MRRTAVQRFAFPVTLGLTLILALLPWPATRWLTHVSNLVNMPLVPLRHGAGVVAAWVSPPDDRPRLAEGDTLEDISSEMEYWRTRATAAEMQISDLKAQLASIQQIDIESITTPTRPVNARITGLRPSDADTSLELNRGTRQGVHVGSVAVWGTTHVVGHIVEAFPLRSIMRPITSTRGGTLLGVVVPDDGRLERGERPLIHLTPKNGIFKSETPKGTVLQGDRVLLADPAWPQYATAFLVGRVSKVVVRVEAPLLEEITITPTYQARELGQVILLVEDNPEGGVVATGGGS
jgi:cell shape-determining protein MreC